MIRGPIGIFMSLLRTQSFQMCANNQEAVIKEKSYRMPEKKQIIPYRTEFPLRLHNYRILLFANKQNLYTPALQQTKYAAPFIVLIQLIRSNPWYLTFPASLPIMIGLEFYLLYRWIIHKRHYKYVIERVYLYQTNMIEFVFSNKIRRKFKGIENSHEFHDPQEVVTPRQGLDGSIEWKERGFPFPTELAFKKNETTNEIECFPPMMPMGYGWTKYCENFQSYIFPKNYEYANWQLLVNLLNGRYIDFDYSVNQLQQLPPGEDYYSLEQELKWIKQDNAINEELRLKNAEQK